MNVSAALLAGGESRRMGRDKAALFFNGRPLWQHQLELLRRLNPTELLLSARSDPSWRPNDITFVVDVAPARGPLSGLVALLGRCSTPHVLAIAVDMPRMTTEFLATMCELMEPGCGVLPMIAGCAEPLAAIYPVEALPVMQSALTARNYSLRNLARGLIEAGRLRAVPISAEKEVLFSNFNRQSDLETIGQG
jgi:molybdopterin-guanine dinucleotide biosynthesis protein A